MKTLDWNQLQRVAITIFIGIILCFPLKIRAKEKIISLTQCNGLETKKWHECFGTFILKNGRKYQGIWENGLPSFGRLVSGDLLVSNEFDEVDQKILLKELREDKKLNEKTRLNRNNLPSCKGKFGTGWNNCFGKQNFKNGTYEGSFKNGLYHGFGILRFKSGEKYIGEFQSNLKHGFGRWSETLEWADFPVIEATSQADWYDGYFENGLKHGRGISSYANGDLYVGEFKNDRRSGFGAIKYKAGGRYEGGWLDDVEDGDGSLYDEAGLKIFSGNFREGKKSGTLFYSSGDEVVDIDYVDGVVHGIAYIKSKKETVLGRFRNGKPYGVSLVVKENGEKVFSIYRDDGKYMSIKSFNLIDDFIVGIFDKEKFLPVSDQQEERKKIRENLTNFLRQDADVFTFSEKFPERFFFEMLLSNFQVTMRVHDDKNQKLKIYVEHTQPGEDGSFTISVKTNRDTASLTINGVEEGGSADGRYTISRVARAGQKSTIAISATDVYGNSASKTITVSRPLAESKPLAVSLNPAIVKRQPERDAVAIIIGIADYKNLPRADYANDDARVFYDYAIRAFGIKPENIKLLVDADADEVGIYRAFKTWLPSRVRPSTDVYVYYSGHGLPTADGQGLYVLPQRADRDFVEETAIKQAEINAAIQAAKPKSVTIFLDACYSGQARTGETLLASARPVSLKAEIAEFPKGFTVITASRGDQLSSSSPELKHGIFSFYLMRGLEGDADANKDGRITTGEMQAYLAANVARQAALMNRLQEPQLIGDGGRVLVGR